MRTRTPIWHVGDRVLAPAMPLPWSFDGGPGEIVHIDTDRGVHLVTPDDWPGVTIPYAACDLAAAPTV